MLTASIKARNQPATTVAALREVVEADESVNTAALHKAALASIEEIKREGRPTSAMCRGEAISGKARLRAAASPRRL
jgi:hypothetical protein